MTAKEQQMPKTLDQLEQEAQQAQAAYAERQAAASAARRRAEQSRADAEHAHDEAVLAEWEDARAVLETGITAARRHLREVQLADPVWKALHDVYLAQHRLTTRTMEYASTRSRLHGPTAGAMPMPSSEMVSYEQLARMVEDHAAEVGRAEAAARDQARADAGQRAADADAGRQV